MHRLRTPLPLEECVPRLRKQVQQLSLFSRINVFHSPTSSVFGRVSDCAITLESSRDRYSKRLVGTLHAEDGGTTIDYAWKAGLGHAIYGDARFDEEEILSFLTECVNAQQL